MSRPPIEVADVIRAALPALSQRSFGWLTWVHMKVVLAILRCRTALLGGHVDTCSRCGYEAIAYNSCRNRHCPRCQTAARERWLEARCRDLLPTPYAHVVFTVPHELGPLAVQNKRTIYGLLFRASAETLLEVARDPNHLGAEIGFFSILHTWNQQLQIHPHIHCVVPAGGLSFDHTRWMHCQHAFFLPVKVLGRVFRGKFVAGLRTLHAHGHLRFHGSLKHLEQQKAFSAMLRTLFRTDWVVYSKPPFGGAEHVVQYLGRYTHRIAISSHRLVALDNGRVTFRWRDSAHKNKQRLMTLDVREFLRRFLLHVLPTGFVRIRYYGLFAHRRRKDLLPLCLRFLRAPKPPTVQARDAVPPCWSCPKCGAAMVIQQHLSPAELRLRSPPILPQQP
jgi:Putative transposase/Transposase zinc-binding domain